jgi:hypothetical protein
MIVKGSCVIYYRVYRPKAGFTIQPLSERYGLGEEHRGDEIHLLSLRENPCEKNEEPAPVSIPGTPPRSFQLNPMGIGRKNPHEVVKERRRDVFG